MKKKKQSAWQAWKMLMLALPKGIAAFITVAAGLSVSLPLSVFLIGLPLLAETLVLCGRMMETERALAAQWRQAGQTDGEGGQGAGDRGWRGWRALLAVLGQGRSYRGILFGLLQLPIGIAAFVTGIAVPIAAFAFLLSPLAYQISMGWFSFELFADPIVMDRLLPAWSGFERSWLAAGIGALFVLLLPLLFRAFGRMYVSWISAVAGPADISPVPADREGAAAFSAEKLPEPRLYA
ncbi:sensor domain-containing protein [Cohnella sp. CFH 77786]|uniref:sensor domain-containing protein n=1 Tax=Cohnella sp. CFH 77786 TaxID=2662265 RepID=UPI001C610CB7|nr:sensor domain-containing protein [Cohnella sp. CFH 77786]